jgi:WD40 repeat protein
MVAPDPMNVRRILTLFQAPETPKRPIPLSVQNPVRRLILDRETCFCDVPIEASIHSVLLDGSAPEKVVAIDFEAAGSWTIMSGSLVVADSGLSDLTILTPSMDVRSVPTSCQEGISLVAACGTALVCCQPGFCSASLVDEAGRDIRKFIGHVSDITHAHELDPNTFVTASSDRSVKVWDVHTIGPVCHIRLRADAPRSRITALCGVGRYVGFCQASRDVGFFDTAGPGDAPIRGITLSDHGGGVSYSTDTMYYEPKSDELLLFGQGEVNSSTDSVMFVDNDKYLFRRYGNFLGRR